MSKDDLNDFNQVKLNVEEEFKDIIGETKEFPKYTTQLINLANQNAQGTRPNVVGQMSELIQICPDKTFKGWKEWYLENYPGRIEIATEKIANIIPKMKKAMELIDEDMIGDWVEDLVLSKTAEGLIIQEIILKYIANKKGVEWRLATPEEESKNIDGFIGIKPVQIKADTYLQKKPTVRESIGVEVIYYKKTSKYITIYTKDNLE